MTKYICDGRCKRGACGCGRPDVIADGDSVVTTLVFSGAALGGTQFRDGETNDAEDARAQMIADMQSEHRKTVAQPETEAKSDNHVVATDQDVSDAHAAMVKDMQSAHLARGA